MLSTKISQVFVDIPGLNCKDRGPEYKTYVEQHFAEFDYFIVLLNGAKFQSLAASEASSEESPQMKRERESIKLGETVCFEEWCVKKRGYGGTRKLEVVPKRRKETRAVEVTFVGEDDVGGEQICQITA